MSSQLGQNLGQICRAVQEPLLDIITHLHESKGFYPGVLTKTTAAGCMY